MRAAAIQWVLTMAGFAATASAGASHRLAKVAHIAARTRLFKRLAATPLGQKIAVPVKKPEAAPARDAVDQASWESFPASDSPGY